MGWWQTINDGSGQIDWDVKRDGSNLINAIPGRDNPKMMYNGDGPADIMSAALDDIESEYIKAWKRKPTYQELLDCFHFCIKGKTQVQNKKKQNKK